MPATFIHRFAPSLAGIVALGAALVSRGAEPVDFLGEVRPILSSHCFNCHGPDSGTRKAGLRLDVRESAVAPSRSGTPAIVPGKPDESELVRRILASDPDEIMPPPSAKKPLTDAQKESLRRWIEAGAEYQPHWAFIPPQKAPVPDVPGSGASSVSSPRNPIDAFVRARLRELGLSPSPEADRLTLVRRLYLDLIGLPPSPEEADAFVRDTRPDAYERLVDRLLASPHYGERWARRWLDLARYADTNGFEKDRVRSMWPWRDWVIRALNADMPFDQFTIEQIAGDMLPGATLEQRIATGFHRNTMINEEGGIDPLEFRFHAMVDRVHTTATTWLGITMACAQCHTHKYDPIEHREYYQFMAFLDNADEPVIEVPEPEIARRREEIEARIRALEDSLLERFPPEERVVLVTPEAEVSTESGSPAERLPDGSYLFEGPVPERDTYTFTLETTATNVVLLNLDVLADESLPRRGPGRAGNGNFVLSEISVVASRIDGGEPAEVRLESATADFEQSGFPVRNSIDGKTDTGWAISGAGEWNMNRRATFRFGEPAGYPEGTRFEVRLSQQFGGGHVLGRVRLSLGAALPDPRPVGERREAHLASRFETWRRRTAELAREWTVLRPVMATSSVPVLTIEEDGSVFASSDQTKSDTYDIRFSSGLKGITALRIEALPDPRLPRNGPGRVYYEGPIGDFFLSTLQLFDGHQPVRLVRPSQTYASGANDAAKAIDDDPQSGWSIQGREGRRHVAVFNLETPLEDATDLRLTLLFEKYYAAGLGRFRISVTTDPRGAEALDMPDDLQLALRLPPDQLDEHRRAGLLRHFASVAPELAAARDEIRRLRESIPAFPTTLAMQERPPHNPRTTVTRHRGEFLQPGEPVEPALPAIFAQWTTNPPRNRLEFARWLVSRENPLTARVTVNREWQAFFGAGLVRTMGDFGFQGELPTHPELLDWLAVDFMEDGWSLKRLHKRIVMSATYRQSSRVTPELLEQDPENRWLARGPAFRLEAELLRDLALAASGLLSERLGGPSVFPPQIPSITREGAYGPLNWVVSKGGDRYRRGLYTFAKRTAPYAAFQTFDGPSGEACIARREVSNTPLQALTLLNDEAFVEAAAALGRSAMKHTDSPAGRATFIFRRCLTRPPEPDELERILAFYSAQKARLSSGELDAAAIADGSSPDPAEHAAWALVARALLNLHETINRG